MIEENVSLKIKELSVDQLDPRIGYVDRENIDKEESRGIMMAENRV